MARARAHRWLVVVIALVTLVCAGLLVAVGASVPSLWGAPEPCQAPADQERLISAWLDDPVMHPDMYGVRPEPSSPASPPGIRRYCDPVGVERAPGKTLSVHTSWQIPDVAGLYPLPVLFDRMEPTLAKSAWTYAGYSEQSTTVAIRFCRTIRATATIAHIGVSPLADGSVPGSMATAGTISVTLERSKDGSTCPPPPRVAGHGQVGHSAHPAPRSSMPAWRADVGPVPHRWWFTAPAPVDDTAVTANGTVYVATDSANVDNVVFALDGLTGALRWRAVVPGRVEGRLAVGDGQVYVGSLLGWVFSLDAVTGGLRWRTLVPFGRATRWRGQAPVIGASHVFVGGADGRLYALDGASGAIEWRTAPGLSSMDGSPPAVIGSTVFTVSSDHRLYALDTTTGALRFSQSTATAGGVISAGTVLCVMAQSGLADVRVNVSAYGDVVLALDPTTGAEIWHTYGEFAMPEPVPGGLVVLGNTDPATAIDRATGAVHWQVVPAGVRTYVGPPDREVFVRSENTIYALDAKTGTTVWAADIGQFASTQPIAADGVVVIASDSAFDETGIGTVFAFADPSTAQ
jgi:outer membrane protein assembly factor BamB